MGQAWPSRILDVGKIIIMRLFHLGWCSLTFNSRNFCVISTELLKECTSTTEMAGCRQVLGAVFADSWLASHESVLLECCLSVVCLLHSWIVAKRCEIDPCLLWDIIFYYYYFDIGLSESAKNWPWMTLKRSFQGHESENGPYCLNGCS